jgi:hypothetical protein
MAKKPVPGAALAAILAEQDENERWARLCQHFGIRTNSPLFDVNSETLVDAIARDPKAARDLLRLLAANLAPASGGTARRKPAGRPRASPAAYSEIAARFVALQIAFPTKGQDAIAVALFRELKAEHSPLLEQLKIGKASGVRTAARRGVERHNIAVALDAQITRRLERRRLTSLLTGLSAEPRNLSGLLGGLTQIIPPKPLALKSRRK